MSDVGGCSDKELVRALAVADRCVADWFLATAVHFAGEAELKVGITLPGSSTAFCCEAISILIVERGYS